MGKPIKFRYVNEIVGTFLLLGLGLGIAGFALALRAQGWFESTRTVRLRCEVEGSIGLTEGAAVEILGVEVGSVVRISVADDGRIEAVARIKRDFFERFVRTDSRAIVKKRYGIFGDSYVTITRGRTGRVPDGEDSIPALKDTELLELAEELISTVRGSVVPAIEEARDAAYEIRQVAAGLRDPQGDLQQILQRVHGIARALDEGKGLVPAAIHDEALAEGVRSAVEEINASLHQVRGILSDLEKAAAHLSEITGKVAGQTDALPELVEQARTTLREAEKLVTAIERHWLIRSYVPQTQEPASIPPAVLFSEER